MFAAQFTSSVSVHSCNSGPRKTFKCADFSLSHRKTKFRMQLDTHEPNQVSNDEASTADEIQAILMRLGSSQGELLSIMRSCALFFDSRAGGMVSECEAQFLCTRLHSRFLQKVRCSDRAAYEVLFVTFLGFSPEAGRHVLSRPYFASIFGTGLIVGTGVAVAAVALSLSNPLTFAAVAGAVNAVGRGAKVAEHIQQREVQETVRLIQVSSHSRPLGFPAFSRILRRYARSKEIVELSLSTLEMCATLFTKFINELVAAIAECSCDDTKKYEMKMKVDAVRSQQQDRLYESGIVQALATAVTLTPSTPEIGSTILRSVNILHGLWHARICSVVPIPSSTIACMKNLCVRGMKTAVYTTHSAVRHKVSGMHEAMKVQVDLFVHSFRLLQMLSSLSDDIENHTHVVEDARSILKQLFKSHSQGIKYIFWTLLKGNHHLRCSCADDDSSCLKGHASWVQTAIFTCLGCFDAPSDPSLQESCIHFGGLVGNASYSMLQCMSIAVFFNSVACSVDCGAIAPQHAHQGTWRDGSSKSLCDKSCSHPSFVSGSHYRFQIIPRNQQKCASHFCSQLLRKSGSRQPV